MKLLYIDPHCSTGGLPQVTLKRIEALKDIFDVYVIEYKQIASTYIVQRSKMQELLGDKFISFGRGEELRDKFEQFVTDINPDIIHLEEIPELFMRQEHADWLYRKDRTYRIYESTHTATFNVDEKKYFPDKFLFVSLFSKKQYLKFDVPIEIIEYPIEDKESNKEQSRKYLGFEDGFFHVLNIGLFTPRKNQSYAFEIARKLEKYKIKFHFVGNQAINFEHYWKPLMDNKPDNCIIWKERNDADKFYDASDMLLFTSLGFQDDKELNPLVIKEALAYNLPIFLFNLDVYCDKYNDNKNVKFLTGDLEKDSETIINFLENSLIKETSENFKSVMISEYERDEKFIYNIDFNEGARVEILGKAGETFNVEFLNKDTNVIEYSTELKVGNWCKTNTTYFKNWRIIIKQKDKIVVQHDYDAKGRNVLINFDTKSLGDNLAFIPFVEEFRLKHQCNVYCSTFWNDLFKDVYPNINFILPGEFPKVNVYARYILGWFTPYRTELNPNDFKKIPLQQTASDILGIEYKEIIPKIKMRTGERPIKEKYVCLAQFSTANAKHWHYPYKNSNMGWQILVDWLNKQGYKVMVISKQPTNLQNIVDFTGEFPIEHRINQIKHCEFFIGIGSGLSWLSWAIGKKVVMISGFSNPFCEFKKGNIRVHNFDVCNGCFNRHEFDRGDWDWCPDHRNTDRQFECSLNITPQMVVDEIIKNNLVSPITDFDFGSYVVKAEQIKIDVNKLSIKYNSPENKLTLQYNGVLPKLNVDFFDTDNGKVYQFLNDVELKPGTIVWAVPVENISGKNISVRFYREKTILKIELK